MNKYEFTLVYMLSGCHVLLFRPVCLIPFVCHMVGTELPRYMTLVQEIVQYCQSFEYNRVHQLRTAIYLLW